MRGGNLLLNGTVDYEFKIIFIIKKLFAPNLV